MLKLVVCVCLISTSLAAPNKRQLPARYRPGGRIIGGEDTRIEDSPYIVSVNVNGWHNCAGSLISDTWVVTAGHCVSGYTVRETTIQGNSTFLEQGISVTAKTLIAHPNFNSSTADFDIGLIELAQPLKCTNCKTIALGNAAPAVNKNVTLLGWGIWNPDYAYDYDYSQSTILQRAHVPVVATDECNKLYSVIDLNVTKNMFCAGLVGVGGVDACQGDSGGPVVQDGKLVGAVSWGYGCAKADFPGVYTLVPAFLDWIKTNTGISA